MINTIINFYSQFCPDMEKYLSAGLVVFARVMGFIKFAPGFSRKDIPTMVKVGIAVLVTIIICSFLPLSKQPANSSFALVICLNALFGILLAYIANCILQVMDAGGDMINMQMGVSAATVINPSTNQQSSIMSTFFGLIGLLLFINIGGFYWLFQAFVRSFEIFPIWSEALPLEQLINIEHLIEITSNVLYIGLQIAAPVLIATLGQDIILGVISRTAPQINVFTMSFLFKPILGCAVLMWVFAPLLNIVNDYFVSLSSIF